MANVPNITNIPGARQRVTNPDGTMDRVWYRYLFNLFNLTGGGSSDTTITDLWLVGPHRGHRRSAGFAGNRRIAPVR